VAERSDAETIRRGYEAFGRGDMDTLRTDVFAADIQWH
jgi:ketosteroid isomerase-like protein